MARAEPGGKVVMPLDRLPRIKVDHEFGWVSRVDIDWLIAGGARLRDELVERKQ